MSGHEEGDCSRQSEQQCERHGRLYFYNEMRYINLRFTLLYFTWAVGQRCKLPQRGTQMHFGRTNSPENASIVATNVVYFPSFDLIRFLVMCQS